VDKEKEMNTLRKTLLTGLAALSLGGVMIGAQAQSQAPDTHPKAQMSKEARQAKRAEFAAKRDQMRAQRIAKLHDELKITPAQEGAWNTFVNSMKPPQRAAGQHDRAAWAGLTAPQRAQKMIDMQKQRTAFMERRLTALNNFYAVLSPDQKKVFDEKAARMHAHYGRHGAHGGWQHRGGDTARG
jgi:periplasmic protein CpxP/Spy